MLSPHWLEPFRKRIGFLDLGNGDRFPGTETLNHYALILALDTEPTLARFHLMNAQPLPIHPLSAIFPEASPEEIDELGESIKVRGLREKIVLLDGHVLDGRNRQTACFKVLVPPIYRDFDPSIDGDSVVSFVRDKNLNRRQLNTSQRAIVAAGLEPYFAEELAKEKAAKAKKREEEKKANADKKPAAATGTAPAAPATPDPLAVLDKVEVVPEKPKTAAELAAEATGVSARSVSTAKELLANSPEQAAEVVAGRKTINKAKKDAEAARQENRAAGEDVAPYRAECADMLEANHGEAVSKQIRASEILKTTNELKAFVGLPIPDQKSILPFIVKGWQVAKAIKFHKGEFEGESTLEQLIAYAAAKGGAAIELNGFTITIEKSTPDAVEAPPAGEAPAPADKTEESPPAAASEAASADDDDIPIGTKKPAEQTPA